MLTVHKVYQAQVYKVLLSKTPSARYLYTPAVATELAICYQLLTVNPIKHVTKSNVPTICYLILRLDIRRFEYSV
jgi:hypothetical protein